jgi:galactokinase
MTKIQAEAFFNDDAEDSGAKILFKKIYGEGGDVFSRQSARYLSLAEDFDSRFGGGQFRIFSAPGRSEIGGNHTDHNNGKVLAASIQLDVIAAASPTFDNRITISDKTFHEEFTVDCAEDFEETAGRGSAALIRGLVNGFKKAGYKAGGFNACLESEIPAGSGVSSSAAFEMLLCCILNTFYNNDEIPFEKWAAIGRYAENVFWGKSSGLLDQIACAAGGMAAIDFKNPESPLITKIQFDFSEEAYNLILVGTGGSHEDLSKEYSIIPDEMKSIAKHFGENVLREAHEDDVIANIEALRNNFGDRAVLRALHFYEENIRVEKEIESLAKNDFMQFLAYVNESGNS